MISSKKFLTVVIARGEQNWEGQGHIQEWLTLFLFTFLHAVSILFMHMIILLVKKNFFNSKKKKPTDLKISYLNAKKDAGYI